MSPPAGASPSVFSVLLRDARRALNLTQKEVATALGITEVTVSNHERGVTRPDRAMVARYRDALVRAWDRRGKIPTSLAKLDALAAALDVEQYFDPLTPATAGSGAPARANDTPSWSGGSGGADSAAGERYGAGSDRNGTPEGQTAPGLPPDLWRRFKDAEIALYQAGASREDLTVFARSIQNPEYVTFFSDGYNDLATREATRQRFEALVDAMADITREMIARRSAGKRHV